MKRLMIRSGMVFCVLLFSLWLYNVGKGHDLLLDNKTVTIDGTKYKALELVEVSVDGGEDVELFKRDRDKTLAIGSTHTITVKVLDDMEELVKTVTREFTVSNYHGMYILSIPALVAGSEGWVREFPLN